MVKRVIITNYLGESVEYKIEGVDVYKNKGLLITEIEGLGPTGSDIVFTKLVSVDGSLYNTSRLNERNIVIHANFTWANTIEEARLSSYKLFPLGKKVRIVVETENRIAYTDGYVEKNEPDIFKKDTDVMISILCEDPLFMDYNGESTSDRMSNIVPMFEFEYENIGTSLNTVFSEYVDRNKMIFYYDGESEIGFSLIVHTVGEVVNPTIYFINNGESIAIPSARAAAMAGVQSFSNGDDIIITSMPLKKTIMYQHNGVLTNIFSLFVGDVEWPKLYPGDNGFMYTADYGADNIRLYVKYTALYEGV